MKWVVLGEGSLGELHSCPHKKKARGTSVEEEEKAKNGETKVLS